MIQKYPDVERRKIVPLAQQSLWGNEGVKTLDYLRNTRKISDEVLKQFQIGYCPREENHNLAGRIIMPLFDPYDNLIALTTRDVENKEFSHWHESFDKSNYLYGLNFAKESIRRNDKAIIVEGQFDVMCFHSFGLSMTVGVLGTAFGILQAIQLMRYCSEIYLIFDPDDGGKQSLARAMLMYNQYCLGLYNIKFIPVILPDDNDPDDFIIKYGVNGVFDLMKKSKNDMNKDMQ